jgi:hypothetical protein
VTVFVADPESPSELAATAISRVRAAVQRFEGQAELRIVGLMSDEAAAAGVAIEPTVAVDDLILATGQAPPAGHIVRALTVALGGKADE